MQLSKNYQTRQKGCGLCTGFQPTPRCVFHRMNRRVLQRLAPRRYATDNALTARLPRRMDEASDSSEGWDVLAAWIASAAWRCCRLFSPTRWICAPMRHLRNTLAQQHLNPVSAPSFKLLSCQWA